MTNGLSDNLNQKLKLLEKETNFKAQKPLVLQGPTQLVLGIVGLLVLVGDALWSGRNFKEYSLLAWVVFVMSLNNIQWYFHQRKIYSLYSTALEIINFYKSGSEPKSHG